MRVLYVVLATLFLAQCASNDDSRFRVGESPGALVIIGVAKSSANRAPRYAMLWRRLSPQGTFLDLEGDRSFEPRTNSNNSVRIRGIPGEFAIVHVEPGVYALDGAFAQLRESGLTYFAQGIIQGPQRPSFEVAPGEAIYLGIWEMDIDGPIAVTRLWRLSSADMAAVTRAARATLGEVRLRETQVRSVPCQPHPMSNLTQRQVC